MEFTDNKTGIKYQISKVSFELKLNWGEAISVCNNLGDGWKLPTITELEIIYKQFFKNGEHDLKEGSYWSSNEENEDLALYYIFYGQGFSAKCYKDYPLYVRPIRIEAVKGGVIVNQE
jgi:hypothetical protein